MKTNARKKVNQQVLMRLIRNAPKIPPGTSGKYKVSKTTILAGDPIPVVSMRNSLFMGEQATKIVLDQPLVVRELSYDGGVWMTDHPQEIWQMRHAVSRAHGSVVIGGLGLGCVSHLIAKLSKADRIVTVEKSNDVAKLVGPYIAKQTLIVADLFEFLKPARARFDFAFFDIWQGTGERDWAEYIVPLRRLCRGKIDHRQVLCWNENEMLGQLRDSLRKVAHLDKDAWYCHEPLRRVAQQKGITKPVQFSIDDPMKFWTIGQDNDALLALIESYLRPGTEKWERTFGPAWDEAIHTEK